MQNRIEKKTNQKRDRDGRRLYPLHAESLGSNYKHAYIYTCKINIKKKKKKAFKIENRQIVE